MMTTRHTPDAVREAVARIVDPKAWEDHDYWASRLRGEGDWPTAPDEVATMRRSYERRMPLRVAESFRRTDAILAALDSRAGDAEQRNSHDDAKVYGIGVEVDGIAIHPGRVVIRRRAVDAQEEAEHIRQTEMQEIADGAYGDGPATRGAARDYLARAVDAVPAGEVGQ